jgi:quinol monooxygenase YgiN
MSKFGLYTKIVARAGQRNALVEVLVDAAAAMQAVTDCMLYIVNTAATERDAVWVTEVWTSREAHQAYLATDDFKAALGRGMPLIERVAEQIAMVPIGGKGLPTSRTAP